MSYLQFGRKLKTCKNFIEICFISKWAHRSPKPNIRKRKKILTMKSINPATNKLIREYAEWDFSQVEQTIELVHQEWLQWKKTLFEHRSALMMKAAGVLRSNKEKYATIISQEMGKPLGESMAEVEKSAWVCEYYAQNAEQMLQDEHMTSDASQSFVSFEPLGIVLAVMPWNFPFWQVFRFAAPALMAGNAAVLKHASNVMGCATAIEEIFREAGFPGHLFRNLVVGSQQVEGMIDHRLIKATTLTGSEFAGSKVASRSGKELKKSVMELGGADVFIVLEDADLPEAVKWGVFSRLLNNGQSCIAAKRFILHQKIAPEFLELLQQELKNWPMGNPMEMTTKLGPMARRDLLTELQQQIDDAVEKGASILRGGKPVAGEGFYFEPTVITGLRKEMKIYCEETFGPVFSIFEVASEEEAIELANDSDFGLGGSIWTRDTERGIRCARQIESGAVFVNGMTKSDPRLPFGGIKKSGFGRELSHYGIKEFLNIKTIWVK
jgi:succinate-semialdehyde dehydrogenase/glutarate-semialdehyde dehydrogenase